MKPSVFQDKISGMILAAAYGDALGAPHELSGLQGNVCDPLTIKNLKPGCDFYHDHKMNQWNVWPPPDVVEQNYGIPTDDTAYRLAILHPWMRQAIANRTGFAERNFHQWMESEALDLHAGQRSSWYLECRNAQVAQWLEMFDACARKKEAVFYIPEIPIVFGLFLYLPLAALFYDRPTSLTYRIFRNVTALDQSYAGIITGITAVLLAEAVANHDDTADFGGWFITRARALTDTVVKISNDEDRRFAEDLRVHTSVIAEIGASLRGKSELEFVQELKRLVYDRSEMFNNRLKNFDPLLFWMQMIAAAAFAPQDPICSLRVLAASAGDADTVPTILGTLAGAWYGMDQMKKMKSSGMKWDEELQRVQACLESHFYISVEDESKLFSDARGVI